MFPRLALTRSPRRHRQPGRPHAGYDLPLPARRHQRGGRRQIGRQDLHDPGRSQRRMRERRVPGRPLRGAAGLPRLRARQPAGHRLERHRPRLAGLRRRQPHLLPDPGPAGDREQRDRRLVLRLEPHRCRLDDHGREPAGQRRLRARRLPAVLLLERLLARDHRQPGDYQRPRPGRRGTRPRPDRSGQPVWRASHLRGRIARQTARFPAQLPRWRTGPEPHPLLCGRRPALVRRPQWSRNLHARRQRPARGIPRHRGQSPQRSGPRRAVQRVRRIELPDSTEQQQEHSLERRNQALLHDKLFLRADLPK